MNYFAHLSGKPDAPKGPLEVTDVTATSAKVKWEKPEDDGGVPIKEYEIERLDTKTGKWVRVGKVPGTAPLTEFEVTGLNPGSEYKFRVTAVNDEGDSEPLESERGIIARNPYGKKRSLDAVSSSDPLISLYFLLDEPHKPGTPEITDYDNESVSLKWTPPDFDGGAPIEKYVIEKKDRYKPDWEKAGEVAGDQLEAKVGGLKERGEYQFRIIAVNKAGPSPPSDASKMQICKHKARECISCISFSTRRNYSLLTFFYLLSQSETKDRSYELEACHGPCWQADQVRRGCSW